MAQAQQTSFVHRRPVVTGVIIGCLVGLPVLGYFGIPQMPQDVTRQSISADQVPVSDLKLRGNKNSRIYHWKGCPNYDDIAERNIVDFKTHEEAQAAGYRKARNCP